MADLPKLPDLVIVPRDDWGAVPPKEKGKELIVPVPYVIITFMKDTEKGENEEQCKKIMQDLQKKHMEEEGFADIGFNFVVGGDGQVYEGRGWSSQPESKIFPEYNERRLDIAYMGLEDRTKLQFEMLRPALQLLNGGRRDKYLLEDYMAVEHPQVVQANK